MTEKEAKELCWFVDSTGLVENSRKNLNNQKKEFAHEHEPIPSNFEKKKKRKRRKKK